MASRSVTHLLLATAVSAAPWEKIGPRNIWDAVDGQGYSGTLADAVSPLSNPNLIYAGGHNNGAASGVLKSTDRGKTWVPYCNGLWDTTVASLIILDEAGDHVLVGTPTGIYETLDGALSWRLMPGSSGIGWAQSMKNGTINGEPHIIAGVEKGLANWNPSTGTDWSVIKAPEGVKLTGLISVADVLPSSVIGVCMGGTAFIATITGPTTGTWKDTTFHCQQMAINPNNKDHFIYSNKSSLGKQTWESLDGGESRHDLNNHFPWHVAIDRHGWLYTAAEAGAHRSMDGGKTWEIYQMTTTQRTNNVTHSRIPMDYQRIITDFAGDVAFVSDQGLFIKPPGDSLELIGACGNMSNNIAIAPVVSQGDGTNRWIVTTAWDWGPLASWDSGAHWPGWSCSDCEGPGYTHGGIGEGGYANAFGKSNHMLMIHHSTVLHSSQGGKNLTRVQAPASWRHWPVYTRKANSRSEPDGRIFILMTAPPPQGSEQAPRMGSEFDDNGAVYIVKNSNFGAGEFDNKDGWVWGAALPPLLAGCSLVTSPVDGGSTLYAITPECIATTQDEGVTWSECWKGFDYPIHQLYIKDVSTMFLLRNNQVPLRTRDGGKTWSPLASFEAIASSGFVFDISWSGKTIVVHGLDKSAIAQGRKAPFAWRSVDDGDTFIDETDDLITNRPGNGYWFDGTFYLTTSGQGIMAKTFEEPTDLEGSVVLQV